VPHALNLTIPIKRDEATKKKLEELKAAFATKLQPKIDAALKKSKLVHFARVLVVHDQYLQVITEYDGDHKAYTEFFRKELPDVFAALFSLADGAPAFGSLNQDQFYALSKGMNLRSLGDSNIGETDDEGRPEGYLFSAYGKRTVEDILDKL
jgi:hypothetical protein